MRYAGSDVEIISKVSHLYGEDKPYFCNRDTELYIFGKEIIPGTTYIKVGS